MLSHDLPPWPVAYQQTQRWLKAGGRDSIGFARRAARSPRASRQPTAAKAQDCVQVQAVTGNIVEITFVDQAYIWPASYTGGCCRAGDQAGDGEITPGKEGMRPVAKAVGGRVQLRMGSLLSAARARLRALAGEASALLSGFLFALFFENRIE
jgi:hypothetical protein